MRPIALVGPILPDCEQQFRALLVCHFVPRAIVCHRYTPFGF
jgi:hypothetical protein